MDYEAETQVLFAMYGISAYDNHPNTDSDSTVDTSPDNAIDVLSNIQILKYEKTVNHIHHIVRIHWLRYYPSYTIDGHSGTLGNPGLSTLH